MGAVRREEHGGVVGLAGDLTDGEETPARVAPLPRSHCLGCPPVGQDFPFVWFRAKVGRPPQWPNSCGLFRLLSFVFFSKNAISVQNFVNS
jgi:hypothetical protein